MRKSEEITPEESLDTEIQLGDLVSFLGELTMHLGSISRFFQSKTGEQAAPVMSLRSKAIQDEIEKSFLAIGREVYTNSTINPEPLEVSAKIGSLLSRVEILQEIMDEINGKTPVEKAIPEARKEAPAPHKEEKPKKPEEEPALKTEEKTPYEAGETPPVKTEDAGPGKVEEDAAAADQESGSASPNKGEAAAPAQSSGEDNTGKKVAPESSS
jgi:outer membrane biosynthesis protein TonB